MLNNMKKGPFVAASLGAFLVSIAMASADTVTTRTIMVPSGASDVVLTPTESVTTSRQLLMVPNPSTTTTSKTVEITTNGLGAPRFDRRLQLLDEQLNNAIARGWLNSVDAINLRNRLADLRNQAATGTSDDMMESQINGLNIDLSHSMNRPIGVLP